MDKYTFNAQNVVPMAPFQTDTTYSTLAQVEAYWDALRRNGAVPRRSDIDPRGIERALENAFILERVARGVARLRIAGSHLNDLMGMEVRGMPLTAMLEAPSRRIMAEVLEQVCRAPGIARLRLQASGSMGRPALEARLVLLPLRNDRDEVSRILGCFKAQGSIGLAPRRFEVVSTAMDPIKTTTDRPFTNVAPAQEPAFAEPGAPFLRRVAQTGGPASSEPRKTDKDHPYLRLVRSTTNDQD